MSNGPLLFLGVFLSVALSWCAMVLAPYFQLGSQDVVTLEDTGAQYPGARPGEAQQGREVYRALGCVTCHTQQVRGQDEGHDLARGWGKRRTVPRDYLYDQPIMLGNLRLGPDLANLGARQTNLTALYVHLFNPRLITPGSSMPPYPFLFEQRKLQFGRSPTADALPLPAGTVPGGSEVVPTDHARALVAYLTSLRADALFFEVLPPLPPKKATNLIEAPGGATNAAASSASTNVVAPADPVAPGATNPPATP